MGNDIYNVFHHAVEKCKDDDDFYDLDKFLIQLSADVTCNESRIRSLAYLILKTLTDTDEELYDEVRYMLDDDGSDDVCIIKHGFNGFTLRGSLPHSATLTIKNPPEEE